MLSSTGQLLALKRCQSLWEQSGSQEGTASSRAASATCFSRPNKSKEFILLDTQECCEDSRHSKLVLNGRILLDLPKDVFCFNEETKSDKFNITPNVKLLQSQASLQPSLEHVKEVSPLLSLRFGLEHLLHILYVKALYSPQSIYTVLENYQ